MQINAVNAALGRRVSDLRKAHGWSQAQLAASLGAELGHPVDATTITRLEQGRRPVPVHELVMLARIFDTDPGTFIERSGPLDAAISVERTRARTAAARTRAAQSEEKLVGFRLKSLEALARYRDTRDVRDLERGLTISVLDEPDGRAPNWRALVLDAGIADESIEAALKATPSFTGGSGVEDGAFVAFVAALIADVRNPPRRRRKTGKLVKDSK